MTTEAVYRITSGDEVRKKALTLLALGMLYKHAGQITLSAQELQRYNTDYDGIRVAFNEETGVAVLSLNKRE